LVVLFESRGNVSPTFLFLQENVRLSLISPSLQQGESRFAVRLYSKARGRARARARARVCVKTASTPSILLPICHEVTIASGCFFLSS